MSLPLTATSPRPGQLPVLLLKAAGTQRLLKRCMEFLAKLYPCPLPTVNISTWRSIWNRMSTVMLLTETWLILSLMSNASEPQVRHALPIEISNSMDTIQDAPNVLSLRQVRVAANSSSTVQHADNGSMKLGRPTTIGSTNMLNIFSETNLQTLLLVPKMSTWWLLLPPLLFQYPVIHCAKNPISANPMSPIKAGAGIQRRIDKLHLTISYLLMSFPTEKSTFLKPTVPRLMTRMKISWTLKRLTVK